MLLLGFGFGIGWMYRSLSYTLNVHKQASRIVTPVNDTVTMTSVSAFLNEFPKATVSFDKDYDHTKIECRIYGVRDRHGNTLNTGTHKGSSCTEAFQKAYTAIKPVLYADPGLETKA